MQPFFVGLKNKVMQTFHVVGIDVSKKTIDVHCQLNGKSNVFENSFKGFGKMSAWITAQALNLADCWFVFEHTGMYSIPLTRFCTAQNLRYSLVSGLAVKRSLGITRGKADHIDARRIACYGSEKMASLRPASQYDETIQRLKRLINLRNRLLVQKGALQQRNEQMQQFYQLSIKDIEIVIQRKLVRTMEAQIQKVEHAIKDLIESNDNLFQRFKLLTSIKGIGFVVAINMIAYTENFTRFTDARKFACYIGTAPFEHSSGTSIRGKTRVSYFAYKKLKSLIDLAAKSAVRSDPELKQYYLKRIEIGKSKLSTINVVRNKLLTRIFAVVKRETPYQIKNMAA